MNWKDLKVWQRAHDLVLDIYRVTNGFPKAETYGLTNQLRRAASSVPACIVEGQSRNTTKEYLQYLYNARGSLEEVRYFLLLARDLGILEKEEHDNQESESEEVSRMLNGLIKSLRN